MSKSIKIVGDVLHIDDKQIQLVKDGDESVYDAQLSISSKTLLNLFKTTVVLDTLELVMHLIMESKSMDDFGLELVGGLKATKELHESLTQEALNEVDLTQEQLSQNDLILSIDCQNNQLVLIKK